MPAISPQPKAAGAELPPGAIVNGRQIQPEPSIVRGNASKANATKRHRKLPLTTRFSRVRVKPRSEEIKDRRAADIR
jgi:hypothetical protein